MTEGSILRVFAFRPYGPEPVFDVLLRDRVLPDLLGLPGIRQAWVGRHGPEETTERAIASVWESREAMSTDLRESSAIGRFDPEHAQELTSSRLDILPIAFSILTGRPAEPGILRIFRGTVRDGELDLYVEDVSRGATADAQTNEGLIALHLGIDRPNRFITVSAWTDWSAVERATGGDVRNPFATRQPERIVSSDVGHFEVLAHGAGALGTPSSSPA